MPFICDLGFPRNVEKIDKCDLQDPRKGFIDLFIFSALRQQAKQYF